MSELRQNRMSGTWALIAPRRGKRPQAASPARPGGPLPRIDPNCPFCPGHENELPGILMEAPSSCDPGWLVRVVPNKFAAVTPQAAAPQAGEHVAQAGFGSHEVVIESPRHDASLEMLSPHERRAVVAAYRDRCRASFAAPDIESVVLFRNHGPSAGASLLHPHAQVIALDTVPPRLAALDQWERRHYAGHGTCATCTELQIETRARIRLIEQTDRFVALVPFAAEHPCETWIVPLAHQAAFEDIDGDAIDDLAELLARCLRRLKAVLNDPPWNLVIDSAPKASFGAAHCHWRLRLVPQVTVWGGFELGSGLPINPSSPEEDAAALRRSRIET